ncbi:hypothetical protein DF185_04115 [Marinifilum breve]|uniref:Uncharacterized protein n=1 Tax=Marinifilum breve TaxID=2184082 RepID=A0A2V3ZZC2_9BACT|nr:hypothetical protein [Marinifilum breve]PXY01842.1 hypothetical protein DF185_04115 [Marinifilum breve]
MNKFRFIIAIISVFLLFQSSGVMAQAIAIKKWKGRYPRMNNNYPQSFIAFRGWLPPKPHLFVRISPTHYYWKVKSIPVTDSKETTGKIKTGLLRIFSKLMERSQFKGRHQETGLIKLMNEFQKQIDQKLFDSRKDQLADIYGLTEAFLKLYDRMDEFKQIKHGAKIRKILKKEANELLERFLMINLLETDHGEKFQAFMEIRTRLIQLFGEVDYSINKMHYFQHFGTYQNTHYAFLTQ